jgi:pimeloyl-ACP methyl ester carboxylesterase
MKKLLTLVVMLTSVQITFSQVLVDATFLTSFTATDISGITLGAVNAPYDVDLYKVTYNTPDVNGQTSIASGLLCVPIDESTIFPLTCYQHGTVGGREDVPSNLMGGFTLPLILAGSGYVVAAPDFLGLGDSPGIHPYVHAATEASVGVDMMRATRELDADEDFGQFELSDQVFVTGYSQGGHAAMALHRVLETDLSNEFTVTGSAPMSGPYSISESMVDFTLGDADYGTVAYIAWLTLSYQVAYPSTVGMISLEEVFRPEYIPGIIQFRDEEIDLWTLNDMLLNMLLANTGSTRPRDLLMPDILNSILTDPTHPFSVALADNDTYDWSPQAPTNMYYCEGDDQVTFENAILAESVMRANGSSATAVRVDFDGFPATHTQCVLPAATGALNFFNGLRNLLSDTEEISIEDNSTIYLTDGILVMDISDDKVGDNAMMLFSQAGQKLAETRLNNGHNEFDMQSMASGLYIISLSDDRGLYKTQKVVKF